MGRERHGGTYLENSDGKKGAGVGEGGVETGGVFEALDRGVLGKCLSINRCR